MLCPLFCPSLKGLAGEPCLERSRAHIGVEADEPLEGPAENNVILVPLRCRAPPIHPGSTRHLLQQLLPILGDAPRWLACAVDERSFGASSCSLVICWSCRRASGTWLLTVPKAVLRFSAAVRSGWGIICLLDRRNSAPPTPCVLIHTLPPRFSGVAHKVSQAGPGGGGEE